MSIQSHSGAMDGAKIREIVAIGPDTRGIFVSASPWQV